MILEQVIQQKTTFGIKFGKAQMFLSLVGAYIVHLKVPGLNMITMNHENSFTKVINIERWPDLLKETHCILCSHSLHVLCF